ncbi:hypothetical protein BDZ91DRAFT_176578 [Kalaharituber pfeilii]|nr:hypothetical protein BDZ91DRAFT_176578 [Kalaharituber pfeilii]
MKNNPLFISPEERIQNSILVVEIYVVARGQFWCKTCVGTWCASGCGETQYMITLIYEKMHKFHKTTPKKKYCDHETHPKNLKTRNLSQSLFFCIVKNSWPSTSTLIARRVEFAHLISLLYGIACLVVVSTPAAISCHFVPVSLG